jgi:hypothetical protein
MTDHPTSWPRADERQPPPPRPEPLVLPRWARTLLIGNGILAGISCVVVLVVFLHGQSNDRVQQAQIRGQAVAAARTAYDECQQRQVSAKQSLATYDRLLSTARPDLDPAIRELILVARSAAERGSVIACTPPPPA